MKRLTLAQIKDLIATDKRYELRQIKRKNQNKIIFKVDNSPRFAIFIPDRYLIGSGKFYLKEDIRILAEFKAKIIGIRKKK